MLADGSRECANKKLIYVIEDEKIIAHTLCLILELSGYCTVSFSSAADALQRINEKQPDLVVSDVMVDGTMNGVDLAKVLATHHPSVKVMLLSGHAGSREVLADAYHHAFFPEFHVKPMAPQILLKRIDTLFAGGAIRPNLLGEEAQSSTQKSSSPVPEVRFYPVFASAPRMAEAPSQMRYLA